VTLESFGRRSYIAGRVPNRPELLQRWLIEPASLVPGTAMPAMGVSKADARDMAAYLGA
jgi:cytochrome c2